MENIPSTDIKKVRKLPKIMSPSEKLEDIIVHCQDTTYDKNNKV